MSKVVSLRGAVPVCGQPDAELVETLEGLLQLAKDGGISGFAYVTIQASENIITGWAGHADQHRMIAGTSILQYRMLSERADD